MSRLIAVVGRSGQGKTASIRNLSPEDTFIINCSNKPLSFFGAKNKFKEFNEESKTGNVLSIIDIDGATGILIAKYIRKASKKFKNIIVDDFQAVMSDHFLNNIQVKGYTKFNEIGSNAWQPIKTSKGIETDTNIIFMTHDEEIRDGGYKYRKIKTIGKMLDEKTTLEGYFTYVLYTNVDRGYEDKRDIYGFETQSIDNSSAKSPDECFPLYIPNDLKLVVDRIEEFEQDVLLQDTKIKNLFFREERLPDE